MFQSISAVRAEGSSSGTEPGRAGPGRVASFRAAAGPGFIVPGRAGPGRPYRSLLEGCAVETVTKSLQIESQYSPSPEHAKRLKPAKDRKRPSSQPLEQYNACHLSQSAVTRNASGSVCGNLLLHFRSVCQELWRNDEYPSTPSLQAPTGCHDVHCPIGRIAEALLCQDPRAFLTAPTGHFRRLAAK